MASFKSDRFPNLGVYFNGRRYKFKRGKLETNDRELIRHLEGLAHVTRLDNDPPSKLAEFMEKEEKKKEKPAEAKKKK